MTDPDFHWQASILGALYGNGAVDLERSTRTIGFERKPVRADARRSSAVGGSGFPVGDGDYYGPDLKRRKRAR